MKYLIASDIHGSAFYAEKLVRAFETEKADRMILLGDFLYHGPRNDLPEGYDPKQTAALLNTLKDVTLGVQGNCDAEIDQVMLQFPIMAQYGFLACGSRTVLFTHGHVFNDENPLPMKPGDVMIYGHFHVPLCEEKQGKVFINPGSVSIPKENSPHSYLILEDDTLIWKNLLTGESFGECKLH